VCRVGGSADPVASSGRSCERREAHGAVGPRGGEQAAGVDIGDPRADGPLVTSESPRRSMRGLTPRAPHQRRYCSAAWKGLLPCRPRGVGAPPGHSCHEPPERTRRRSKLQLFPQICCNFTGRRGAGPVPADGVLVSRPRVCGAAPGDRPYAALTSLADLQRGTRRKREALPSSGKASGGRFAATGGLIRVTGRLAELTGSKTESKVRPSERD
jgi:hypothetical protein